MKKRIVSSIAFIIIALILGLTDYTLATEPNVGNENIIVENQIVNTTGGENNTEWYGVGSAPTDLVNDINNQLQNMNSAQPKDNRRATAVTIIIIITVALIAILVTWYYMTNQ